MNGAVADESRVALRSAALLRRDSLALADSLLWSSLIQAQALELPQYLASRSVALYSPVQNEVDTGTIQRHALDNDKRVFYPKTSKLDWPGFYQIFSPTDLTCGRFAIPEPLEVHPLSVADEENLIVFVPGVVFDHCGNRLGRGGGWYDRKLAQLNDYGVFVGLAYEFQVVENLAAEKWDRKVHFVITEKRVIDCGVRPLV
jgi:5-formyltetrahydrofolate cyclo-ligase